MARDTFRRLRRFMAPRWLTTGEGLLVGYALDLMKDAFAERARLGMLAGYPQNGPNGETAPPDALVEMGRDRRVVKGIDESAVDYATRLRTWLDDRRTAGNPFTLMRQLSAYVGSAHGVSFRTVDVRGNWYSRSATGVETSSLNTGNWNWDGDTDSWARFWVIIYPGTRWIDTSQAWGSAGTWGNATTTWGSSTITEEQTRTLQAIVADWKPGGTRCHSIILALDPASFNPASPEPNGTWAHWANRLTTALYLDGS